jgi:hypothetical protein
MSTDNKRFPFRDEVCNRFCKWLDIKNTHEIEEAIEGLTGDTYFEMRKLISRLLTEVENMVSSGKYSGYLNGKELTDEEKQGIKDMREDHKEFLRLTVEETWRDILNKQKVGIDKLSLSLKPHMNTDETNMDTSDNES